jgi:hypothetical protein
MWNVDLNFTIYDDVKEKLGTGHNQCVGEEGKERVHYMYA